MEFPSVNVFKSVKGLRDAAVKLDLNDPVKAGRSFLDVH